MKNDPDALVSIIIVTIGSKDYLGRCLDSLKAQSYANLEVIVIDNSLNPDFSAKIRQAFNFIKLYSNEQNLYYSASLNQGIGLSRGEFILALNDDVVLDKNFIRDALAGFLVSEKIGSVSGKILRSDRKTIDSTGLFLGLGRCARERGYGKPDSGQFEQAGFIFGVNGSAAFYRKKMLEGVKDKNGYFDSRLVMFYEDLDISWRAQKCGWQAYYIPAALAYHVRGGSFRPDSGLDKAVARRYLNDRLHYELIKNRYLTLLKNETFQGLFLHFIPVLIYELCTWAYVLIFQPQVAKLFFKEIYKGRLFKKRF